MEQPSSLDSTARLLAKEKSTKVVVRPHGAVTVFSQRLFMVSFMSEINFGAKRNTTYVLPRTSQGQQKCLNNERYGHLWDEFQGRLVEEVNIHTGWSGSALDG